MIHSYAKQMIKEIVICRLLQEFALLLKLWRIIFIFSQQRFCNQVQSSKRFSGKIGQGPKVRWNGSFRFNVPTTYYQNYRSSKANSYSTLEEVQDIRKTDILSNKDIMAILEGIEILGYIKKDIMIGKTFF